MRMNALTPERGAMMVEGLRYQIDRRVAAVTFTKPGSLNLLTADMLGSLGQIAGELSANDKTESGAAVPGTADGAGLSGQPRRTSTSHSAPTRGNERDRHLHRRGRGRTGCHDGGDRPQRSADRPLYAGGDG